jgi:ADP-ribose pyrophosphatase YjhB (NUDIX family)
MINKNGDYLLVERAVEPAKGYWDFPGGFVEENETFEENARREMKEELGIVLGELTYIGSITAPYLFQGVIYPTIAVIFITELLEGTTLKPDDDVASYAMFAPGKLPMDKLAFPEIKNTFKLVAEYLKNHKI